MQHSVCCRRSNCLALLILASTTGLCYLAFEPKPAGAHVAVHRSAHDLARLIPAPLPQSASGGTSAKVAQSGLVIEGKLALLMKMALLREGQARLLKSPSYTATFLKQEKIGKNPLDQLQTIEMKLRHEPFSVYMKWITVKEGQEVLYVDGELDNRMLVKKGGFLSRIPSIKIAPDAPLALKESRHPVTDAGLLKLTEKLLDYRTRDLERLDKLTCEFIPGQMIAGRKCHCFSVIYTDQAAEPLYSKTFTWIDEELCVPVCVKNYTWENADSSAEEEEETVEEELVEEETVEDGETLADNATPAEPNLIEFYTYADIAFQREISPQSFDSANKDYSFKRQ